MMKNLITKECLFLIFSAGIAGLLLGWPFFVIPVFIYVSLFIQKSRIKTLAKIGLIILLVCSETLYYKTMALSGLMILIFPFLLGYYLFKQGKRGFRIAYILIWPLISISAGFYINQLLHKSYDEINNQLAQYKELNHHYPNSLSEIKLEHHNKILDILGFTMDYAPSESNDYILRPNSIRTFEGAQPSWNPYESKDY